MRGTQMHNLLLKGYLMLAYLSLFEVNRQLWIQIPSSSKRPFLVRNCHRRNKKIYIVLVRHLERKAKIIG